jgi:hypothetical protein
MSAHTPGPWASSFKTNKTKNLGVYGRNGHLLATLDVHQLSSTEVILRRKADARVMAAAPDLLEALRDVLKYVEHAENMVAPGMFGIGISKARAAITKAEGQS